MCQKIERVAGTVTKCNMKAITVKKNYIYIYVGL